MKQFVFRPLALFLALVFFLSACSSPDGAGKIIKYDLPSGIANLDPQFATDETERMIISNTFEGLFRQLPDGTVEKAAAQSYEISPDGLSYTFRLRDGAVWSVQKRGDEPVPVTAHDFAFAFVRIFDPAAPSPFAPSYLCIENAQEVLSGKLPADSLGVRALDDYTLRITLERPESRLPTLLASSGAMPCNEAFFRSTRARYGLEKSALQFNGPFLVTNWNNERAVSLRANSLYTGDNVIPAGVELIIPSELAKTEEASFVSDPVQRFLNGTTDACRIDHSLLPAVRRAEGTIVTFEDTVWVLALNTSLPRLAEADIRRAVAYSIDRSLVTDYLPENLNIATTLIPPAITFGNQSFREYAGENTPQAYSPDLARRTYRRGLEEAGIQEGAFRELLICDDDDHGFLAGLIQGTVQKELAVPIGLTRLSREDLLKRVRSGDFEAAIIPLTSSYSSPEAILSHFRSGSPDNVTGYTNGRFDALLDSTAGLSTDAQKDVYRQAEQLLLAECPAIPLYFETTYYAMGPGISDIGFSPFLSGMRFSKARKRS